MNKIIYLSLSVITMVLASCTQQQEPYERTNGTGTVVLNLSTTPRPKVSTRAVDNDLNVEFIHPDGSIYQQFSAGQDIPQKLTLEAGIIYTVRAYTPNQDTWQDANGGLGEGCYYGETSVTVGQDQVAYLNYIVPMTNCAVTFTLPDLFDILVKRYSFTVEYGSKTITISTQGTKAYIPASAEGFKYKLQATNNDEKTSSHATLEYPDTQRGKLYNIKYVYAGDFNSGNIDMDITDNEEHEDIDFGV